MRKGYIKISSLTKESLREMDERHPDWSISLLSEYKRFLPEIRRTENIEKIKSLYFCRSIKEQRVLVFTCLKD